MLTIELYKDSDIYIKHDHVGFPGCSIEQLEISTKKCLEKFLKEITNATNIKG
jgi:hypothetical protein